MLTSVNRENLKVKRTDDNLTLYGENVFTDERHIKFADTNFYCILEEVDLEIGQFKVSVYRERELVGMFFNFEMLEIEKSEWLTDPKPGDKEALYALATEMLKDVDVCYINELKEYLTQK